MIDDFLMRQIMGMTEALAREIFDRDMYKTEIFSEQGSFSGEGMLYHELHKLMLAGSINEAENKLFYAMEAQPCLEYLRVGQQFYTDLAGLSDDTLRRAGFTREEILQGQQELMQRWRIFVDADEHVRRTPPKRGV